VRLAALGNAPVSVEGDFTASLDGVEVKRLDGWLGGTRVRVEGGVTEFADPCLELAFEASVPDAVELTRLFSEGSALPEELDLSGPLTVTGELVGPPATANLTATVSLPGEVAYAGGGVVADAEDLTAQVCLLDLSDPNVRGSVDLARLAVAEVEPSVFGREDSPLPGPLGMTPLEDLRAEVLWSEGSPVAHTSVRVAKLTAGDLAVEDLQVEAAMAGSIVDISGFEARALDAEVSGAGVLDLADEDGLWAYVEGQVTGLDMARIEDLPDLDLGDAVGGTLDAEFAGVWRAGEPDIMASVVVDAPAYGEFAVEDVRALAHIDADGIEVERARFAAAEGVGWAQGVIPWEGDIAARFAVGGVDLVEALAPHDIPDIRGEVWLDGAVSGGLDSPQVTLAVQGFGVGWQDHAADAVIAELHGDMSEITVDSLYASAGRITASVDGTLGDLQFPVGEEASLVPEDGVMQGRLRIAGPMDADARERAGIEDLDIEGAVRLEAELGGTLRRPALEGQVFARYGRYETVATDAALMQVRLEGDVLELDRIMMQMGEAVLQGEASVTSLYDEPFVSVRLSVNDVMLQDLDMWRNVGLPLSGRVSLPYLSVQGPLDNLKGLVQIEAADLELGDEQIGGVAAWVVLDNQALLLRRTTLALAGGELSVQGQYRLASRELLPSQVELSGVSISRLLAAAQPIAATFADTPDDLSPLSQRLASMSMRLRGTLDASVSVEGTLMEAAPPDADPADRPTLKDILREIAAEVDIGLADASYDMKRVPDVTLKAAVTDEGAINLDMEATEDEALLTVNGDWDPDGEVDLMAEVFALDIASLHKWLPDTLDSIGGQLNLSVKATGADIAPELIASVDIIDPEISGARFDLISAPLIRVADGYIDVDSLVVRAQEQEASVDGRLPFDWETMGLTPDGELQVRAGTVQTDLGIFPRMIARALGEGEDGPVGAITASGTIDSEVTVSGTIEHPQLTGKVGISDGEVKLPAMSTPVSAIALNTEFSALGGDTLFDLKQFSAQVDQTVLHSEGQARLVAFSPAELTRNHYDFTTTLSAPLQSFGQGLVARKLGGEVTLRTDEEGRQELAVKEFGARLGGGTVQLDGTVRIASFVPGELANNDYDLTLVFNKARPKYSNIFMGTVDGLIRASNPSPGAPVQIAGGIELTHTTIGLPPMGGEPAGELMGMSGSFPCVGLDVALAIGPDVKFNTAGVVAPLEPAEFALRVSGTPQRPVINGLVEVQEGRASIPTGALDVGQAGVQFMILPALGTQHARPPVKLEMTGRVWGTATKRIKGTALGGEGVGDVEVVLEVSGALPDGIRVQASSQPPLTEEQIYALLGTEQLGGLMGGGDGQAGGDVMSKQFVTALGAAFRHYIFQPFTEDLKKMLGLSMLKVSFAFDQPVEVKIGKYLVEDLLVTYETSMLGTENEWELGVSYKVANRYEVTYQADSINNHRMFVEYVRTF
jgi:autotransporter translocation and assembly factor TamB